MSATDKPVAVRQCPHCLNDDQSLMERTATTVGVHPPGSGFEIWLCSVCSKVWVIRPLASA